MPLYRRLEIDRGGTGAPRMRTLTLSRLALASWLMIGSLSAATSPKTASEPAPSSSNIATIGLEALGYGSWIADSPLEVADAAFAYCSYEEKCDASRVLRIGKDPMQFLVVTKADRSLKGTKMDITLEILTLEDAPVFEHTFTIGLDFVPNQLSRILWKRQPTPLRRLEPGRYRYRVTALSENGRAVGEWNRAIVARRK